MGQHGVDDLIAEQNSGAGGDRPPADRAGYLRVKGRLVCVRRRPSGATALTRTR